MRKRVSPGRVVRFANSTPGIMAFSLTAVAALFVPIGRWRPAHLARAAGAALLAGAWLFGVATLRRLGPNYSRRVVIKDDQRLITGGAYSRVRHPMYSATMLMYLGACLAVGSGAGLLLLAVLVIPRFVLVARYEEELLAEAFDDEYADWKRGTGRFWPKMWRASP